MFSLYLVHYLLKKLPLGSTTLWRRHESMRRALIKRRSLDRLSGLDGHYNLKDAHVRVWRFAAPRAQSILLVEFCSSSSGTKGPEREGNCCNSVGSGLLDPTPGGGGGPPGRGGPRTCTPTLPLGAKIDPPFGPFGPPP